MSLYAIDTAENRSGFDGIVGHAPPLLEALARIRLVAPTSTTVLLQGETGVGKELMASAIHALSRRRARPFVALNCAAMPQTLVETELFGHERGAFTHAVAQRAGRFETADGGTLFLDEVGDLPLEVQPKLLRVLQTGEFERVGSSKSRRVDVRVVAATNVDLEQAVRDGRFRADLFYRLNGFPLRIPPLRDRRSDIPLLVWSFIQRKQPELGRCIKRIPDGTMEALVRHDWPGNVRELENVIERALIVSTGDVMRLDDDLPSPRVRTELPEGGRLADMERLFIERTLASCGWRINGERNAADRLGLHPNTLRFRMRKLGIQRPQRLD